MTVRWQTPVPEWTDYPVDAMAFQKTTVSLIGQRAAVSKSDFYKHFESKDECFFAAYEAAIERIRKQVQLAYRREAKRGPRRLRPLPGGG